METQQLLINEGQKQDSLPRCRRRVLFADRMIERMNLTGQPRLGQFLLVTLPVFVKHVVILTPLLRLLLLSRRLSLILLVLPISSVHTWNTPFPYWIPRRWLRR